MTRRGLLIFALALSLGGCATEKKSEGYREISAAEAAQLKTLGALFYDANGDDFRRQHGVVPGAGLLSSWKDYDLKELPADKSTPLVFYCANKL